jgi:hypothetical protein
MDSGSTTEGFATDFEDAGRRMRSANAPDRGNRGRGRSGDDGGDPACDVDVVGVGEDEYNTNSGSSSNNSRNSGSSSSSSSNNINNNAASAAAAAAPPETEIPTPDGTPGASDTGDDLGMFWAPRMLRHGGSSAGPRATTEDMLADLLVRASTRALRAITHESVLIAHLLSFTRCPGVVARASPLTRNLLQVGLHLLLGLLTF